MRRLLYFIAGILLVFLLLLFIAYMTTPSKTAKEVPPEIICEQHLEQIGKVLLQYRNKHGSLPPAVFVDPNGNKTSWRVALSSEMIRTGYRHLPKQRQEEAIDALKGYNFDERWDSTKNLLWAEDNVGLELLWVLFNCPLEVGYDQEIGLYPNVDRAIELGQNPFAAHYITYLMLVRPDLSSVLPDDAVIVVESLGCGVRLQEPKDIELEELLKAESPFGVGKLNSLHPKVVKAIRADGKVIDIPKDIGKDSLRKLLQGVPVQRDLTTDKK